MEIWWRVVPITRTQVSQQYGEKINWVSFMCLSILSIGRPVGKIPSGVTVRSESGVHVTPLSHTLARKQKYVFLFMYLGRAWASPTLVWLHCARACVCLLACLLACLDQPLTVNFKWAHSNISRRSISWSMWRPVESECSVGDPERRRLKLKHAWQLNSDLCLYRRQQAAHRQ